MLKRTQGVGPYTYSDLSYDTALHKKEAAAMWEAIHAFTDE